MNIVPGGSFFQTVSGSAAQAGATRPSAATSATLQAQAAAADPNADAGKASPAPGPFGPRGSIIDIIA